MLAGASLTRPIRRLIGGTRKVEEGDLAAEIHFKKSDELASLPQSSRSPRSSWRSNDRFSQDGETKRLIVSTRKALHGCQPVSDHSSTRRSLSAFVITDTELKLIAAAAIMGESNRPKMGYNTPAATGTPSAL